LNLRKDGGNIKLHRKKEKWNRGGGFQHFRREGNHPWEVIQKRSRGYNGEGDTWRLFRVER